MSLDPHEQPERDCVTETVADIYEYPELYDRLFRPDQAHEAWVARQLREYFPDGIISLIDPACGTGYWLDRLECRFGLGIDINPTMVRWCTRQYRSNRRLRFAVGDMRAISDEYCGRFDLAINLEATVGHLRTEQELFGHLRCMATTLRRGGIYLLGCPLEHDFATDDTEYPDAVDDWIGLSEGRAQLTMSARKTSSTPKWPQTVWTVVTEGSSVYPKIVSGTVVLRRYSADWLKGAIGAAGFTLASATYMHVPGAPSSPNLYNLGLVAMVLRAND